MLLLTLPAHLLPSPPFPMAGSPSDVHCGLKGMGEASRGGVRQSGHGAGASAEEARWCKDRA